MGRKIMLVGVIIATALMVTSGTASAAIRHPDGQMTGPSAFVASTCEGATVGYFGTGTFAGTEFGIGSYALYACLSTEPPGFTFTGSIEFTFRSGAKLRGTINNTIDNTPVRFLVDVTGGTKRFANARGTLELGPFTQTDCTLQEHLICIRWTDTGHIGGTLIRVKVPAHP
jgi:hypothetical protein